MYSITLYAIDIHIMCLEPFLPLYDHFENLEIFGTELAVLAETLSYTMSKKTERYKAKRLSISVKLSPWPNIWEHMIKADP